MNSRSKAYGALLQCCGRICGSKEVIYNYLLQLEKIREAVNRKDFKLAEELSNEI